MTNTRSYSTALKKAKMAIVAVERKLTQAQITSEYGVHSTQVKAWKQTALKAMDDVFSGAHEKEKNVKRQLLINAAMHSVREYVASVASRKV